LTKKKKLGIHVIFPFRFAPLKREVIVKDSVVTGITFSQLKAELKGRVQCLDPALCANFVLHLRNTVTDITVHDVVVKSE
jgi:hypothetical protein